jgi:YYY domain-containing protein
MINFLKFWLTLELLGLAALPLAWRLFHALPGRGLAFAKALGLLLAGYTLWLGASFGLLRNDLGGAIIALLAVLGISLWLARAGLQRDDEGQRPLLADLRAHWRYWLGVELLFLIALAGWAAFRAYNPDIAGTEKPMEIAFINGAFNSSLFPPQDPWLAGYGISYYYFGYVMLNMLARLSGVATTVVFNLGLAAIFAFAVTEPFALAYALVRGDAKQPGSRLAGWIYGLLAGLFVALMGNLEVLLEALHAKGLLPQTALNLFDIKDLASAPVTGSFNPNAGGWWWWRASRVIHDYNLPHTSSQEVIDEFPQFSFILGDMHPHVLAIPFAFLLMALALTLIFELKHRPQDAREKEEPGGWQSAWNEVRSAFGLNGWGLPLAGIMVGAMGFLNTWDFPIYVFLLTTAYAIRRGYQGLRWSAPFWQEIVTAFLSLTGLGILFYLPFYLSFSSQAGGPLPNVVNPTRFVQFFLMFGVFLTALFFLLLAAWRRRKVPLRTFLNWLLAIWLLPALFLTLSILLVLLAPGLRNRVAGLLGGTPASLLPDILRLRLTTPFTWLIAGALLAATLALLTQAWSNLTPKKQDAKDEELTESLPSPSLSFTLILFGTGLLLTYAVEFIYLRDTFGTRMNTVFKFYYQAWLLMSVASAYALYYIQTRSGRALKTLGIGSVLLLTAIGLLYPAFAIPSKAGNFQGDPTLDGAAFIQRYQPELYQVMQWLNENTAPDTVILEAPGRSYTDDNFISAFTGRPTLLGWSGHELQWRGSYDEPGRREPLIGAVYKNQAPELVRETVQEFGIQYLIVGPKEREKYKIAPFVENSYLQLWEPVFNAGPYTIYRWQGGATDSP